LKQAARAELIVLKFLDEAGFCLWSPVSYTYSRIGQQKLMEQSAQRYGSRISILGLWDVDKQFDYALAQGGFNTSSYLKVMNAQAKSAQQRLQHSGMITVIVQDNGSIHTSQQAKAMWPQWQQQGLFIFMLPAYCPELNDIETQWRQLKTHQIAGRMFSNEYDLAVAVIEGMEARAQKGRYTLNRFKFNSA
jgi:putative transposase